MTEVKCGWSACKWNTAHKAGAVGFCMAKDVQLDYVEVFDEFGEVEDAISCDTYEDNFDKLKGGF